MSLQEEIGTRTHTGELREKTALCQPSRETPGKSHPTDALISDFQPPARRAMHFCCFSRPDPGLTNTGLRSRDTRSSIPNRAVSKGPSTQPTPTWRREMRALGRKLNEDVLWASAEQAKMGRRPLPVLRAPKLSMTTGCPLCAEKSRHAPPQGAQRGSSQGPSL